MKLKFSKLMAVMLMVFSLGLAISAIKADDTPEGTLLSFTFEVGYWNSRSQESDLNAASEEGAASNTKNFIATSVFAVADLPAGSTITLESGYQYRFVTLAANGTNYKVLTRTNNLSDATKVITLDDLYGAEYIAFNISPTGAAQDLTEAGKADEVASKLKVYATNTPIVEDRLTLKDNQWDGGFNNEHVPFIRTWATAQDLTKEAIKTLVEDAMDVAMTEAITDGVVPANFDFGGRSDFGEWSGILKLEYKYGGNTANIFGRNHLMLVISPASLKNDGSVEAFLMINELFVAWNDNGGFGTVGMPTSKPFVFDNELYQNFTNGYVDGSGEFVVDKQILLDGTVVDITVDDPIGTLLSFTVEVGYWNSRGSEHDSDLNAASAEGAAANTKNFVATSVFAVTDLPAGSTIIIENGYQYRFVTLAKSGSGYKVLTRTENISTETREITLEDIYGAEYVAFNISPTGAAQDLTEAGKADEVASKLKVYATDEPLVEERLTLKANQWSSGFNNEHATFLKTWATTQGLTQEQVKVLVEEAIEEAFSKAITNGVVPANFDFGGRSDFGEWSGILKLEYKYGENTANIFGRKHLMVVIAPESVKEDGTIEAFLMINDLFVAWNDNGAFGDVGMPTSIPFAFDDELYQNFTNGYVDGSGEFVYNKHIDIDGTIIDLGLEPVDPEEPSEIVIQQVQWDDNVNKTEVEYLQSWMTKHNLTSAQAKALVEAAMAAAMTKAENDGIVPVGFDWGEQGDYGEWSGILKMEFKNGDHTANLWGRNHAMLVVSASSLKEDGTVEVFIMLNDLFVAWYDGGEFAGVGYPTTAPIKHNDVLYQNFSKGFVDEEGNFVVDKHIKTDGTIIDLSDVGLPEEQDILGVLASTHDGIPLANIPAYGWVLDLGAEEIERLIKEVYNAMAELGFDYGVPKETARLWSAEGDGSGGREETNWIRQEFILGDHTAYLWDRVHGYIFVSRDGNAYAVFNEILLEWHGGWSDKGGPTGNPIYVELEVNGETVVDVYQNFENVYIYVPNSDRSLATVVTNQSITEEQAIANSKAFYGIDEGVDPIDPTDPNEEEESTNLTWLWITLGVVVVIGAGAGAFVFFKKRP